MYSVHFFFKLELIRVVGVKCSIRKRPWTSFMTRIKWVAGTGRTLRCAWTLRGNKFRDQGRIPIFYRVFYFQEVVMFCPGGNQLSEDGPVHNNSSSILMLPVRVEWIYIKYLLSVKFLQVKSMCPVQTSNCVFLEETMNALDKSSRGPTYLVPYPKSNTYTVIFAYVCLCRLRKSLEKFYLRRQSVSQRYT